MDKYMKKLKSVTLLDSGDDDKLRAVYENSVGDRMYIGVDRVILKINSSEQSILFSEVSDLSFGRGVKQAKGCRIIHFTTVNGQIDFLVDTFEGKYLDIFTVYRQLGRLIVSSKTGRIKPESDTN